MAPTELIDGRVSLKQCKLAIDALHTHESKKEQQSQETELLPGKEPNIWLNVTVKKMPSGHKFKPAKMQKANRGHRSPIEHPLIDPRTTAICLITKDPQREYKDLLQTHNIKFISRVVGVEKLKGKFKPFEARRMLLKENGLFLADERIIPLLPKLLGSKWFEAKKQPIPVCLKRKDLKGELERAVSSTYMNQNRGTCTSIKFATLSHNPKQVLANLKTALPAIAKHIAGGWDNIQALHIKTNSSVSLPIWSCTLDDAEGGRWAVADVDEGASVSAKRKAEEEDEEEENKEEVVQPKKKSKGSAGQSVVEPTPTPSKSKAVVPPSSLKATTSAKKKDAASETPSKPTPIAKKKKDAASETPSKPAPASAVAEPKSKKTTKKADEPVAPSVTKDELKQKRSSAPGEKKKSKVHAVGTKSAKNKILGKKAGQ
ncbi:hypothetical protein H0H92_001078 [Tricholoma furcatifolium]|nr:hypothetical protein H0H92_001078 [Tricholoma furcatifolium]